MTGLSGTVWKSTDDNPDFGLKNLAKLMQLSEN